MSAFSVKSESEEQPSEAFAPSWPELKCAFGHALSIFGDLDVRCAGSTYSVHLINVVPIIGHGRVGWQASYKSGVSRTKKSNHK